MTTEQKMTDAPSEIACKFGNEVRRLAWFPKIDVDQLHEMYALLQGIADAELTRLRAQLQWRPISEAPRDGTWIWTWSAGATRPAQVCWLDGEWKDDEMIDRPNYIAAYDRITHFMPLPPPPGGES